MERERRTISGRDMLYVVAGLLLTVQWSGAFELLAGDEMTLVVGYQQLGAWQKPSCAETTNWCFAVPCNHSPCNTCTYQAYRNWDCVASEVGEHKCRTATTSDGCGLYVMNGDCVLGLCLERSDSTTTTADCGRRYFEGPVCKGALPF